MYSSELVPPSRVLRHSLTGQLESATFLIRDKLGHMNSSPIFLSLFGHVAEPIAGRLLEGDWSNFVDGFREPLPASVPKDCLPLWSPVRFHFDPAEDLESELHCDTRCSHRCVEDVTTVHALTLDVDEDPIPCLDELHAAFHGRRVVVHTSSSATATAPRWRAAMALSRPVTADEYPRLWSAVVATLPFPVGDASKDPARQWFAAREGADGSYEMLAYEGQPLDVDALLAQPAPEDPRETVPAGRVDAVASSDREDFLREITGGPTAQTLARREVAAKFLGENWAPSGKRAGARLAVVGACFHDGLSKAEAVAFAKAVHAHVVDRADDDTDLQLERIGRDAFAKGEAGKKIVGWPSLEKSLGGEIVSRARGMLSGGALRINSCEGSDATVNSPEGAVAFKRLTPAQRALKVGGKGIRLSTGFPSIDVATRGGLVLRKVVAIGGAPGAGKTATAVQFAYLWLLAGVHVAFFAADEDADALLIRFGQLAGLSRDRLEDGDADEKAKLAAWCESVPLMLVDGDEDETLERVSRDLRDVAAGEPSVLIVDSIQTARTAETAPKGSDIRTRVNVVVRVLKHAAKVDGHLVVATSEISKAAYRNKAQAENINPLSAFKESGDIEYGISLAIVLTSRQGTSELVDAVVAKNRLGPGRPEFMLKLDHSRAGVSETNTEDAKRADPLYFVKVEVLETVREHMSPMSRNSIHAKVGGNRRTVLDAINELIGVKTLFEEKRGIRFPLPGDAGYVESRT